MVKWVVNWAEAQNYRASDDAVKGVVWAVQMPEDYPECRVTRRGIAAIAITDSEVMVAQLREDGGEARILP